MKRPFLIHFSRALGRAFGRALASWGRNANSPTVILVASEGRDGPGRAAPRAIMRLSVFLATATVAFAQGTLYFSNHVPSAGLEAPVFDTDGVTGVQGYWFQAQLYAGAAASS